VTNQVPVWTSYRDDPTSDGETDRTAPRVGATGDEQAAGAQPTERRKQKQPWYCLSLLVQLPIQKNEFQASHNLLENCRNVVLAGTYGRRRRLYGRVVSPDGSTQTSIEFACTVWGSQWECCLIPFDRRDEATAFHVLKKGYANQLCFTFIGSQPPSPRFRLFFSGLLFAQYVNKAASTVRGALKEPAKRQAMAQEVFSYKVSPWEGGSQGPKTLISELKGAGTVQ
jgi:Mitochondrial ATP synthase epsilon chain